MKLISELYKLQGKTVLLRADLDAPNKDGKILDDYRICMTIPTIEYLQKRGAKIIIISKNGHKQNESLELVAGHLAKLLDKKFVSSDSKVPDYDPSHLIFFKGDITKPENIQTLKNSKTKDIIVLENIRFYPQETDGDINFAKQLAGLGDIYVNDAFAMMHRNEVSISILPNYMPAYAGLNVEKELRALNTVLNMKAKPFVVMMGGAKISDKVCAIKNLGKKSDQLLIGGGPANLFYFAKGYEIGKSICEKDQLSLAQDMLRNFKDKIVLPIDVVVADQKFQNIRICQADQVKKNELIFDIGPKTIMEFSKSIKTAKKLVWSGPVGYFERKEFSHGTMALAIIFASRCKGQAYGLVGGGDTHEAMDQAKVTNDIDFVSTAGSAVLDYLGGEQLPGIQALELNRLN
jgi:phosphoglycerate kinase